MPFSRGFSWPKDKTQVSCIAGRFFIIWATKECKKLINYYWKMLKTYWYKAIYYLDARIHPDHIKMLSLNINSYLNLTIYSNKCLSQLLSILTICFILCYQKSTKIIQTKSPFWKAIRTDAGLSFIHSLIYLMPESLFWALERHHWT